MQIYCKYCKELHDENDLCERYKKQLKEHPEWINEVIGFSTVAAENYLITSQAIDKAAQAVNKLVGTNLSFEGTHQLARDVQVFSKLNTDAFSKSGVFSNAESAKEWFLNHPDSKYLKCRLNGTGQEVDWLRQQQGSLKSIFQKSALPDGNTVGYDGETVSRFTGKTIERVSIKAASTPGGINTNVKDIIEAIEKGTLSSNDRVVGIKGTKKAFQEAVDQAIKKASENGNAETLEKLQQAKTSLKITESSNIKEVNSYMERLKKKILGGKANPYVTASDVAEKMVQGAVIGAAIELSLASITCFIRYKNGEIDKKEAFRDIGESAAKGAVTGGAMSGITIFLPAGPVGWIAGMAIGIYLRATVTNLLDEVFGKGAYEQILDASGYIMGTAKNLGTILEQLADNVLLTQSNHEDTNTIINHMESNNREIENTLDKIDSIIEEF